MGSIFGSIVTFQSDQTVGSPKSVHHGRWANVFVNALELARGRQCVTLLGDYRVDCEVHVDSNSHDDEG
jgi:hypothetical protein